MIRCPSVYKWNRNSHTAENEHFAVVGAKLTKGHFQFWRHMTGYFLFSDFWISVMHIRDCRHSSAEWHFEYYQDSYSIIILLVFESKPISCFMKWWVHQDFCMVHRKIQWLRRSPSWPLGGAWHILNPLPHCPSGTKNCAIDNGSGFQQGTVLSSWRVQAI